MDSINEYAAWTSTTWSANKQREDTVFVQPQDRDLLLATLGLAGETGEFVEKIKKIYRDGTYDLDAVRKELGDVIYYWARCCSFLGMEPSDVIGCNISKLTERRLNNTLHGSGDNR